MDEQHSHLAMMLGTYIKESRLDKCIQQKELADQIGISAQFLGRAERGQVMLPLDKLKVIAKFLDLKEAKIRKIYQASARKKVQDLFKKVRKV